MGPADSLVLGVQLHSAQEVEVRVTYSELHLWVLSVGQLSVWGKETLCRCLSGGNVGALAGN